MKRNLINRYGSPPTFATSSAPAFMGVTTDSNSSSHLVVPPFPTPGNPTSHNSTPAAQKYHETKRRPAFEKIGIGPLMCFAEDVAGGHYLEVLRLGKQMHTGWSNTPSYRQIHSNLLLESSTGLQGVIFRGFFPWGMIQGILKGAPVLFVQNETKYVLKQHKICRPRTAEQISGCMSGAVQALIMTPFQKLKVTVVASDTLNRMKYWRACGAVVSREGMLSLFDGLFPTMLRRSIDWGIRFGACAEIKKIMIHQKQQRFLASKNRLSASNDNAESIQERPMQTLTTIELMICSSLGGAISGLTHPIDNVITNAQKPLPAGSKRDIVSVVRRMITESGVQAFTRGWCMRIVENSYHMIWMYGIGTLVYDSLRVACSNQDDILPE